MTRFFLRIITDCVTQAAEQSSLDFFRSLPGITEIHAEAIQPYRKNPEQGELFVRFLSALAMAEIQALLADCWEGDVADRRCSCIHVPHAVFLWLTT